MSSRRRSSGLKAILAISLLANLGLAGYWFWPKIRTSLAGLRLPTSPAGSAAASDKASVRRDGAAASVGPAGADGDRTSVRIRLDGGGGGYCLKILGLEAKSDGDPRSGGPIAAAGAAAPPEGPLPGVSREILSLPAGLCAEGSSVQVSLRTLAADETAPAAPADMRSGCCRLQLAVEYGGPPGGRTVAFTALGGTYHDRFEAATRKWEAGRLPLWRCRTADGHGNQFAYEVYLEKR